MLLPAESSYGSKPSTSGRIDTANPFMCGFGHSRPEHVPAKHDGNKRGDEYAFVTPRVHDITLDMYHHPAKRENTELRYLQSFDVYS